jgi:hypothetical protein
MSANANRIQFVISGPFIVLLLLATGFLGGGFWLYTHQPPPPVPQTPPYYVNRISTALRPCYQCLETASKLKPRADWKLGNVVDIPTGEQWWFAPVEDHPTPAKIDGVPMLAVHPSANREKPWSGFDQRKVYLVVFQDLDGRFSIEHPPPPPPTPVPVPTPATETTPTTSAAPQQP